MKSARLLRAWTASLLALAACEAAHGQFWPRAEEPHAWRAAASRLLKDEPDPIPQPGSGDVPLLIGEKPWHVTLYLPWNRGLRSGSFCQGTLVAKRWVLTAASCVCGTSGTLPPMQALLREASGTRPGQSVDVKSAWIYHERRGAPPLACVKQPPFRDEDTADELVPIVTLPSQADLALLELAHELHGNTSIEVLGADPSEKLLESLIPADPAKEHVVPFEFVQWADRQAGGMSVYTRHAVALSGMWTKNPRGICPDSSVNAPGGWRWCADFELAKSRSDVDAMAGTGIILADHKRPLLVAVWSAIGPDSLTYLSAAHVPSTQSTAITSTIAWTMKDFTDNPRDSEVWVSLPKVTTTHTLTLSPATGPDVGFLDSFDKGSSRTAMSQSGESPQ